MTKELITCKICGWNQRVHGYEYPFALQRHFSVSHPEAYLRVLFLADNAMIEIENIIEIGYPIHRFYTIRRLAREYRKEDDRE